MDWYYIQDGQRRGPESGQSMARLAACGAIAGSTLVWCSGLADWVRADSVLGLLAPPIPGSALESVPIATLSAGTLTERQQREADPPRTAQPEDRDGLHAEEKPAVAAGQRNPGRRDLEHASGWLTGLAAYFLGRYSGSNLLIPLVAAGVTYLFMKRLAGAMHRIITPFFAIQAGHLTWLVLGFIAAGELNVNVLDLLVFGAALAWLLVNPGLAPIGVLVALQGIALWINFSAMTDAFVGSDEHRALAVHVAFRVLAITLGAHAAWQIRRRRVAPAIPALL